MAWTVSGNLKGPKGDTGTKGDTGLTGADGTGVTILGSYATSGALIAAHPTGSPGDAYLVAGDLYVWSATSSAWVNVGSIQGPAGVGATVAVGSVTALGAGVTPTITNVGTANAATLNFGIPAGTKGDPGNTGDTGTAATITVGMVTALSAGATPTITNAGTSAAAKFNFGIPAGANGTAGTAATVAAGSATALSAGATPTVSNSGTSTAAVFNFGIPAGVNGTNGTNGAKWFTGSGAPGSVPGSAAGDKYLDVVSGDVYSLS